MQSFMACISMLRAEMTDSQEEVAALAEQSVNAWIDADWAASFFEMGLQPDSAEALKEAEVWTARGYIVHCAL